MSVYGRNMALSKKRKAELRKEADYQGSGEMGCTGEDMEELLNEIDDLQAKIQSLKSERFEQPQRLVIGDE